MTPDAYKSRLRTLLTEANKLAGDLARHQLDWAEWDAKGRPNGPPDWLIDKDDELLVPFEHLVESLFLTTVCLLDSLRLSAYLSQFYRKFGKKFDAKSAVSRYEIDHYWSGEPYNSFLADIRQFLAPFDVLDDEKRFLQLSGVQYLETVLRNTASIIHHSGTTPTSEPQVYKAVRGVLEAVFPSARSPKSSFIKSAQEYKPDILIPELAAAVEYKYVEKEARLKSAIAQISDDVKGYTGDKDYNLFYAVFYVKTDFWGQDKFSAAWKEKKFPKNWKAFYVVGK
ncbi:hypothetical protein [Vreelandella stevensii]|uniref:hypothetical protein n=1 Tax=Vreelandella stevensii TaxID=502821 RepID=UPI0037483317